MAEKAGTPPPLKVAVVTGHHPLDFSNFRDMFRSLAGTNAYIQHMEDFVSDLGNARGSYDTVVFCNMHQHTPGNETNWYDNRTKPTLEELGTTPQRIFMLHHALLAFPKWPMWPELVGIEDRRFRYYHGQKVRSEIVNRDHPITRGLEPWETVDETYTMADAGEGSEILLTYDHPKSMKTIAWTRQFRNSRVFCYEAGHDGTAYEDPDFREVVRRGILWAAGRI
jgi:hypothetical protein